MKTFSIFQGKIMSIRIFLYILIPFMALGMAACGAAEEKTDAQLIRDEITKYSQEVVEINKKIGDLEKQLEALGETTQARTRIPVMVNNIEPQPFDHYFQVSGQVEAVREAMISPETIGQITDIAVNKGQSVSSGQVLARLNTSVIENSLVEIKTSLQLAETVYNRQQRLWEQGIGSEMQYLESKNNFESLQSRLKSLEAQLEMSVMRAPFNGVVDDIFTKEGELASPGMAVMQVINLSELYINADISEAFLPNVNPSDKVILRFPAYPGYEETVPIFRLGNVISPDNRTFRLQLKISNTNQQFKPNMVANMSVKTQSMANAVVIPSILIKQDLQGFYVYLAGENSEGDLVANKTYIERGLAGEGLTQVKDGIEPGDQLIVEGHNRVSDGALIEISEGNALAEQ